MDSRSAKNYTIKYPPIAAALKALKHKVVLDGEMVVFKEKGRPDFDALQLYNGHNSPISYCVFDILLMDGYTIRHVPLADRKKILKQLVERNKILRFSDSFANGPALYEQMLKMNP